MGECKITVDTGSLQVVVAARAKTLLGVAQEEKLWGKSVIMFDSVS